jgi:hypothetical protein
VEGNGGYPALDTASGDGAGGDGGTILVRARTLHVDGSMLAVLSANGGDGGYGVSASANATAQPGAAGGAAGLINLATEDPVTSADRYERITASGGKGGNGGQGPAGLASTGQAGGPGRDGGNGGSSGYVASLAAITMTSAPKYNGGDGGKGGDGGGGADGVVQGGQSGPGGQGGNGGQGGCGGKAGGSGAFCGKAGGGGAAGQGGYGNPRGQNGNPGNPGSVYSATGSPLVTVVPVPAAEEDSWTIMLYIAADIEGPLEAYWLWALQLLEKINLSGSSINLLVCLDRGPNPDDTTLSGAKGTQGIPSGATWGKWTNTRMGWVTCQPADAFERGKVFHTTLLPMASDPFYYPVPNVSEMNTGDPGTLVQFATWAIKSAPAMNYALLYGGHGAGFSGLANDYSQGDIMDMPELRSAFSQIASALPSPRNKLDVFATFGCSLQAIEVATEIADTCSYYVATEEEISTEKPNPFNLYSFEGPGIEDCLAWLTATPRMDAKSFATLIQTKTRTPEISLLDLSQVSALNTHLSHFAAAVIQAPKSEQVKVKNAAIACSHDLNFNHHHSLYFKDLDEFLKLTLQSVTIRGIREHAQLALNQLQRAFIKRQSQTIAAYLPYASSLGSAVTYTIASSYFQTTFSKQTDWGDMLSILSEQPILRPAATEGRSINSPVIAPDTASRPAHLASSIRSGGDVSFISLAGNAGQEIFADVTALADSSLMPKLTLYGPDKVTVLASSAGNTAASLSAITLPANGTYYLAITAVDYANPLIAGQGTNCGTYLLTWVAGLATELRPSLRVSDESIDFGHVATNLIATQFILLTNIGRMPLMITNIATTGATGFAVDFSARALPYELYPNDVLYLTVSFAAIINGPATGRLDIYSNDPEHPTLSIPMSAVADISQNTAIKFLQGYRLTNGQFQTTLSVASGKRVVLQASTNLSQWQTIGTLTSTSNRCVFGDTDAFNYRQRYYRAMQAPLLY